MEELYGKDTVTRFRPHHFPFTEPSCEMDVQCHKCRGEGCPTCKGEGWIEVLGARHGASQGARGLRHRLRTCIPAGRSAWVWSVWRIGHFKIGDLRLIFENDVRFLEQF